MTTFLGDQSSQEKDVVAFIQTPFCYHPGTAMFVAFDSGWNVIEASVVLSLKVLLQGLRNDDGSVGKISRRILGALKKRFRRFPPFLSLPIQAVDLNDGLHSVKSRHKRKHGWTQCVKMHYINVGT